MMFIYKQPVYINRLFIYIQSVYINRLFIYTICYKQIVYIKDYLYIIFIYFSLWAKWLIKQFMKP